MPTIGTKQTNLLGQLGQLRHAPEAVVRGPRSLVPGGQDYILEGRFSLPDIFLASMVPYMQARDVPVTERVLEHFRRCEARPAYQRAHQRCYPDGVTTP